MPIPTPPMQLNSVPNSPQSLDQTQNPILQNFVGINNAFYFNHVQYNDGSGFQGKHTYVQMPVQTVTAGPPQSPGYPFASTDTALYSNTSLVTGKSELVFVRGAGTPIGTVPQTFELSSYGVGSYTFASGSGPIVMNYQWSRLPSGLLLLWASQTNKGPGMNNPGLNILFPNVNTTTTTNPFPGFTTALYNVQVTLMVDDPTSNITSNPIAVLQGSYATTQFKVTIAVNGNYTSHGSISYFAMGI